MRRLDSLIYLAACIIMLGCEETGEDPVADAGGADDAGSVVGSGDAAGEDAVTPGADTTAVQPDGAQDTAELDAAVSTEADADAGVDTGPTKVDTYAECKMVSHCPDAGPCLKASCVASRCVYASVEAKGCFEPPDVCAPGNRRPWRLFAFPGHVRIGRHLYDDERFRNLSSLAVDALPQNFQHAVHISWRDPDSKVAELELAQGYEANRQADYRAEGLFKISASGITGPVVDWFFNFVEKEVAGNHVLFSPLRWMALPNGDVYLDRFDQECHAEWWPFEHQGHLPGLARYGLWNVGKGYTDLPDPPCVDDSYWSNELVNWDGKPAVLGYGLNVDKMTITSFEPDGTLGATINVPQTVMPVRPSFLGDSKLLWQESFWTIKHPRFLFSGGGSFFDDPEDELMVWYSAALEQTTLAATYELDWKLRFDTAVEGVTLVDIGWTDRSGTKNLVFGGFAAPDDTKDSLTWTYELWGIGRSDGSVAWRRTMDRRVWPNARWASSPLKDNRFVSASRWNMARAESTTWPYFGKQSFRSFPAIGVYDSDTGKRLWERVVPGVDAENPRAVWEYQESAPQLFDVGDGSFALFHRIVDEKAAAKDGLDPRRYLWREYGPDGSPCLDASKDLCLGKVPADCEDGDPCTFDFCLPAQGCVHKTYVDAVCDLADGTRGACNSAGQCEPVMW